MRIFQALCVAIICQLFLYAPWCQALPNCKYLVYDGFDYAPQTPLHQQPGGTGWSGAWEVQAGKTDLPGYQGSGAVSLSFDRLVTHALLATGGRDYLNAGRKLDVSQNGPLAPYLYGGAVAANGKTIWFSGLLRKDQNNDTPVWLSLHGDGQAWYVHPPRISVGFFGASSKVDNLRYWSLQINDSVYRSTTQIIPGQAAFLVVSIMFDSIGGHVIKLFVNPPDLGNAAPPIPTLTQIVSGALGFRSIGLYLGSGPGNGAVDEIRLADSWQCATPTPEVSIDLPPTATVSATATDGQIPFTVTLDGRASQDMEGAISNYEWSFGDGTPGVSGSAQVTHTYTSLGKLRPSLTVTDSTGQKNTGFQTLTIRDADGVFPCQSSVTMLQRPSCGHADGKFQVNPSSGSSYVLTGSQGQAFPVGAANTYANLPVGAYKLTAQGASSCRDVFSLYMQEDSSTCAGWTPSNADLDIGMNLDLVSYYSRERAFRDFMKSAGTWIPYQATGPSPWNSGTLTKQPPAKAGGFE